MTLQLKQPDLLTMVEKLGQLDSASKLKVLSILTAMFAAKVTLIQAFDRSMFADDAELFGLLGAITAFCNAEDQFVLCRMLAMHLFAEVSIKDILEAVRSDQEGSK